MGRGSRFSEALVTVPVPGSKRFSRRGIIEAIDGPLPRYLRSVRERFGDEVFDMFALWPAKKVDRFIEALYVPFEDSKFALEEEAAQEEGTTSAKFDAESLRQWVLLKQARDPRTHNVRYGTKRIVG